MDCKIFLFQFNVCAEWLVFIFQNGIKSGRVMAFNKVMECTGLSLLAFEG